MTDHIPLNHPARAAIIAQIEQRAGGKPSKYHNEKATVDGITFASQREARRYAALQLEQRAGVITDLRLQVAYPLIVNQVQVCRYVADFVYQRGNQLVVEDAKGYDKHPLYRLKKKLMWAIYAIEIVET